MIKLETSWTTLMQNAQAVGKAKKLGDSKAIIQAEQELKAYEDLIKSSGNLSLHIRNSAF